VNVDAGSDSLNATGYAAPDGASVVCVVINTAKTPAAIDPAVQGFAHRRIAQYVTDESRDLAAIDVSNGITLPARSVSTIIFER
jgi:hypothetical protein